MLEIWKPRSSWTILLVQDGDKARLKPRQTPSLGNKGVAGGQVGGQKRHATGRVKS